MTKHKDRADAYEKKIRNAIDRGIGLDEMMERVDVNISVLTGEMLDIRGKLDKARTFKEALIKFCNPEAEILTRIDPTEGNNPRNTVMTSRELKLLMMQRGLTVTALAKLSGKKPATISGYRSGGLPVHPDVAAIVRGYVREEFDGSTHS